MGRIECGEDTKHGGGGAQQQRSCIAARVLRGTAREPRSGDQLHGRGLCLVARFERIERRLEHIEHRLLGAVGLGLRRGGLRCGVLARLTRRHRAAGRRHHVVDDRVRRLRRGRGRGHRQGPLLRARRQPEALDLRGDE